MESPKTPEEEIQRAHDAASLLANPIFLEACKRIEDGLASQRRAVPLNDSSMHSRLILTEQLWLNLKAYLEQVVMTGKMADFKVREEEARQARFRLFNFR